MDTSERSAAVGLCHTQYWFLRRRGGWEGVVVTVIAEDFVARCNERNCSEPHGAEGGGEGADRHDSIKVARGELIG